MMQVGSQKKRAGRRPASWQEMAVGIAITVAFHGTLLMIALFAAFCGTPEEEEADSVDIVFDEVELLALGEELDPDMMPRVTGDQGTPPPPEEVAEIDPEIEAEPEVAPEVEPDPEVEPEVDPEEIRREREAEEERRREEEEERAREERQRRMNEALGRLDAEGDSDDTPEGSSDGVAGGTSADADSMLSYQARLLREIERHWRIPTAVTDAELEQLAGQVRVQVYLTPQGHIDRFDFRAKSGHEQFDGSIERVLRVFISDEGGEQLPLPEEPEIRQAILDRGLMLARWETLQRR